MTRDFLAVVPGDARVDLQALKTAAGGTYVAFASTQTIMKARNIG